ncbi:MAG: DUF3459 domain-containing protein, partial [Bacteroidota bacterium]
STGWEVIVYGELNAYPLKKDSIYAFERKLDKTCLRIVLNFSSQQLDCPVEYTKGEIIFSNYDQEEEKNLRPWEGRIYKC